jgi:hypothetical protein
MTNPTALERLSKIETLWRSGNNTHKHSFDGFIADKKDVDWLISELKLAWEREQIACEALEKYSEPDHVLSGSDYQMYATSSSRHAYDDGGQAAREALEKIRGKE